MISVIENLCVCYVVGTEFLCRSAYYLDKRGLSYEEWHLRRTNPMALPFPLVDYFCKTKYLYVEWINNNNNNNNIALSPVVEFIITSVLFLAYWLLCDDGKMIDDRKLIMNLWVPKNEPRHYCWEWLSTNIKYRIQCGSQDWLKTYFSALTFQNQPQILSCTEGVTLFLLLDFLPPLLPVWATAISPSGLRRSWWLFLLLMQKGS